MMLVRWTQVYHIERGNRISAAAPRIYRTRRTTLYFRRSWHQLQPIGLTCSHSTPGLPKNSRSKSTHSFHARKSPCAAYVRSSAFFTETWKTNIAITSSVKFCNTVSDKLWPQHHCNILVPQSPVLPLIQPTYTLLMEHKVRSLLLFPHTRDPNLSAGIWKYMTFYLALCILLKTVTAPFMCLQSTPFRTNSAIAYIPLGTLGTALKDSIFVKYIIYSK